MSLFGVLALGAAAYYVWTQPVESEVRMFLDSLVRPIREIIEAAIKTDR